MIRTPEPSIAGRVDELLPAFWARAHVTPKRDGDRRYYLATGGLDISAALGVAPGAAEKSLMRLVAGAGFEPATFGL